MSEKNNKLEEMKVNLSDRIVGAVEVPKFDAKPYISKTVKIASVDELKGVFGYFIQVVSEPVETITKTDGSKLPITAKASFGLLDLTDNKIGWAEDGKLSQFLKRLGVEHYKDLVDKEVVILPEYKDDKTFLTF